jgi:TPR repeat protein
VTWFRKAAEQGHDLAQFHLGEAYATGTGGTRDLEEARRWFFRAEEQGVTTASWRLNDVGD